MSKPDGGPAFPQIVGPDPLVLCDVNKGDVRLTLVGSGMTLRDYFAAKAMAFIADPAVKVGDERSAAIIAQISYTIADAMLKEREK